jgi:hypothetical protein
MMLLSNHDTAMSALPIVLTHPLAGQMPILTALSRNLASAFHRKVTSWVTFFPKKACGDVSHPPLETVIMILVLKY